ncbi:alpha/beta hydrolase family protein [Thalassospira lucentensis]|uniref:alpha/beta hydrolase family protein n=1 Tax=Thalassospira lucentensis TaxID=168935 RepID=UPI003D2EE504
MRQQHSPDQRRKRIVMLIVLAIGIAFPVGFALNGLNDFDLSDRHVTELGFVHDQDRLFGSLVLPDESHDGPVALIVHGDGPQNRFSNDTYLPLINTLLDRGIGIYSWDKPGIEQSSGNWLDQSMSDRASEALAAYAKVTDQYPALRDKTGFIGFSQAGWVVPKVLGDHDDVAFGVMIGGAINWQDQGAYYTRKRMQRDGIPEDEIVRTITKDQSRDAKTFAPDALYEDYLAAIQHENIPVMSAARFGFVKRNITSDAQSGLQKIDQPFLALFGEDDLNVDARKDSEVYRENLNTRHQQTQVTLIPDATHGLLRSGLFNYQRASEMPVTRQLLFTIMGRYAYAPDAIEVLANWILQTTTNR